MKNKITVFILILSLMTPSVALALSDYTNEYHYDNMEDVYEFDLGTYKDKDSVSETNSSYGYYTDILNKMGFIPYKSTGKYLTYGEYLQTLNKLVRKQDINPEVDFSEEAEKNVTMYDAVVQMCDALGLLTISDKENIINTAYNYGLLDGITYVAENNITTGEFSKLLWNTLNAEYISVNMGGVENIYKHVDGCILEDEFGIHEVTGILDGMYNQSVYVNDTPLRGEVFINGLPYKSGESGAEEYFGMRVRAYVQENEDEYVILYAETDSKQKYVQIDINDIEGIKSNCILYTDEDGKNKKIKLDNITNVMYNNDRKNDLQYLLDYENYDGVISFVNSEKNGDIDTAIIKNYSYFAVYAVSSYEEKIYLNYDAELNGSNEIDLSKSETLICTSGGGHIDWTEITPNSIIRVIQNADKTYTEIVVSNNNINSNVTSYDKEDNIVTIDENTYRIAKSYLKAPKAKEIKTNSTGTFLISDDGYIAGYISSSSMLYGYVYRTYYDEGNEECIINIYTQLGEWKDYTLKDKATIDENKMSPIVASQYLKDNSIENTVIRYRASSKGEINQIDTIIDGIHEINDETRMLSAFKGSVTLTMGGGKYFKETQYSLFNDATVFKIPDDRNKKGLYSVTTSSGLVGADTVAYLEMYTPNDFKMCRVAVAGAAPAEIANENVYWMYVESIGEKIDEDDEFLCVLKGTLYKHSTKEYQENYELTCTETLKSQLDATYKNWAEKGSFLRVSFDKKNALTAVSVGFTGGNCEEFYTSIYNYYNTMCGRVLAVDPTLGDYGYMKIEALSNEYIIMPRGSIIIVDSETKESHIANLAEVEVGDKIFVHYAANGGRIHVVIR